MLPWRQKNLKDRHKRLAAKYIDGYSGLIDWTLLVDRMRGWFALGFLRFGLSSGGLAGEATRSVA